MPAKVFNVIKMAKA